MLHRRVFRSVRDLHSTEHKAKRGSFDLDFLLCCGCPIITHYVSFCCVFQASVDIVFALMKPPTLFFFFKMSELLCN